MSGEGVGKIKPKRVNAPKKPYDRSTSFLGKIKDSVKDLLIPSWLVRSSDAVSESGSQNGPDFLAGSQPPSAVAQRQDQRSRSDQFSFAHGASTSSLVGSTHSSLTGAPYLNETGPAPNVNIAALEQRNVSWHAKPETAESSTGFKSVFHQNRRPALDSARVRMSNSFLNETESEAGVQTGQLMMSTSQLKKHSVKQGTSTVWSSEGSSLRKGLAPPIKDKPAFNSQLFASPLKGMERFGDSSFYSGKTCYGGSASRRKSTLNKSLPYQSALPLRKQVTATKLNSSLNATTSSTAQRILETLDRMSTPLGDAKKIPQEQSTNDSIISFTPSSYRRSSSFSSLQPVTRPLQLPNRGPPTSQHQTLLQVAVAKNRNKVTGVDRRQRAEDELIVSQETPLQDAVQSSVRESAHQHPTSSNTGKLKTKKFSQHMSNKNEDPDEVVETPELPTSFTLPITNINPISFSSPKVNTSSPPSIPSRDRKSSNSASLQFTFSTPIEERRPSVSNTSLTNSDQGFKFSSPIRAQSKSNAAGAVEGSKLSPEPAVGASSVMHAGSFSSPAPVWGSTAARPKATSPDIGGTSSSFKTYNKWSGFNNASSTAPEAASPAGFALAPAATLKSGSVMDILGKKSPSPVSAASPKGTDDLMAKFKKPAGSWECDTCMLSNKPEATRCVACEAAKPGSKTPAPNTGIAKSFAPPLVEDNLMAKFKKPAGSWECDTCMLSNKAETIKCIACEAPKPGAAQAQAAKTFDASNNSLASMFKKPPGNWECDTCMVQNTANASRCIACDTPKPGLEAAGTVLKKPEAPAVQLAAGGGFVINSSLSSGVGSTSGFKFGNSGTSNALSTSLPAPTGFVFGQSKPSNLDSAPTTTTATVTTMSTGAFKFGSTTGTATTDSSVPQAQSLAGGFSFGKSSVAPASSLGQPFQFGSVASTTVSSTISNISSVVEVTPSNELSSNGVSSVTNNNKSDSNVIIFGATSSTSALANSALSIPSTSATPVQPQINFTFNAPAPSALATETKFPVSSKPPSGLFQFGASSGTSTTNGGLGMGSSVVGQKPMVNGQANDSSKASGFEAGASASPFVFGQTAFSAASGTSSLGQTSKRTIASDETEPISKKAFSFGSTGGQVPVNGGFHFGGAEQTAGGMSSGAGASASAPAQGGFVFGSSSPKAAAPLSGAPNPGGGFQFGVGSAGSGFGMPAATDQTSFKPGGIAGANFNFGAMAQSSNTPFQFGAKPADAGAPASTASLPFTSFPPMNGPSFGNAPGGIGAVGGSFNLGSGGTDTSRKVKRAVRRIPRR